MLEYSLNAMGILERLNEWMTYVLSSDSAYNSTVLLARIYLPTNPIGKEIL